MNLQPGDRIDYVVEEDGKVVLEAVNRDVNDLEEILHKPGIIAVSINDMKKSIKKRFSNRTTH